MKLTQTFHFQILHNLFLLFNLSMSLQTIQTQHDYKPALSQQHEPPPGPPVLQIRCPGYPQGHGAGQYGISCGMYHVCRDGTRLGLVCKKNKKLFLDQSLLYLKLTYRDYMLEKCMKTFNLSLQPAVFGISWQVNQISW